MIDRLAPDGDVAHEEDVGEFASWDAGRLPSRALDPRAPRFDYKMVDDDFLLAPIVAHYLLLDSAVGRARAAAFLTRQTPAGVTYAAALAVNLRRVVRSATPFAAAPMASSLVAIRDDVAVGNWRDSQDGLGGGRIPFDVNVALVPAALAASHRLYASSLVGIADRGAAIEAENLATAWAHVGGLFRVVVPRSIALERVRAYGLEQHLDVAPALASIQSDIVFPALALGPGARTVDVMHTDDGFVLLFAQPSSDELVEIATRIARPFPAGLLTPVGVVVANPAYAPDAALRERFTRAAYHGTVVWSWQQAMLAAGFARQLERADLTPAARDALIAAQASLWRVIEATRAMRGAELWSFDVADGHYVVAPFGQSRRDADEANAAQLWSTVYLAVHPPRDAR